MKTLAYLVLALCLVGCTTTSQNLASPKGIETCTEWEVEKCPPVQHQAQKATPPATATVSALGTPVEVTPAPEDENWKMKLLDAVLTGVALGL